MKIGVFSGAYGALQPVKKAIEDLKKLKLDEIVNLGNLMWKGNTVEEVNLIKLLSKNSIRSVIGNNDYSLIEKLKEDDLKKYSLGLFPNEFDYFTSSSTSLGIGEEMLFCNQSVDEHIEKKRKSLEFPHTIRSEFKKIDLEDHFITYVLGRSSQNKIYSYNNGDILLDEPVKNKYYDISDQKSPHIILLGNINPKEDIVNYMVADLEEQTVVFNPKVSQSVKN